MLQFSMRLVSNTPSRPHPILHMMENKDIDRCSLCSKCFDDHAKVFLKCKHWFCEECSGEFRISLSSCPKCRQSVPLPGAPIEAENDYYYEAPSDKAATYSGSLDYGEQFQRNSLFQQSCSPHGNVPDFYCNSCGKVACPQCLLDTHKLRDHEVASLKDIVLEQMNSKGEELNKLHQNNDTVAKKISQARKECHKDEKGLKQQILEEQERASKKIQKHGRNMMNELEVKVQATLETICHLENRHSKIAKEVHETEELCDSSLKQVAGNVTTQQSVNKFQILESRLKALTEEAEELSKVPVPENLGLSFQTNDTNSRFGVFSHAPENCDEENVYAEMKKSSKWSTDEMIDIGVLDIDYANIVSITEDWIAHISSEHGSNSVTIRHYSLKEKRQTRNPSTREIKNWSWTIAKTAGHDLSILMASGDVVYRISFRRAEKDLERTFQVPFHIEAISWDEFSIDCYLLTGNLRDVYWLSMNGDITYLCAFKSQPESVSCLTVNAFSQLFLLDIAKGSIHAITATEGRSKGLRKKFPLDLKSEDGLGTAYSMIQASDSHGECFLLFYDHGMLHIGHYDDMFNFVKWVIEFPIKPRPKCLDLSLKNGILTLLCANSIACFPVN